MLPRSRQPCPPLIPSATYTEEKPEGTRDGPVTLARIAEVSRLLHPVGLGTVSQFPSPGSRSHGPYGSQAWWAVTPPTTIIRRSLILWRAPSHSLRGSFRSRNIPVRVAYGELASVSG